MKGKRIVDLLIFVSSAAVCVVSFFYLTGHLRWISCMAGGGAAVLFLAFALRKEWIQEGHEVLVEPFSHSGGITELALLNEDNQVIATWEMYGKTSLVIGRDTGENQVNVNLNQAEFASMIDVEHAVLNYSGGNWYVEDLSSKNGISVVKPDGKKYRLSSDKPCLLGLDDILCVAMTRLLIR